MTATRRDRGYRAVWGRGLIVTVVTPPRFRRRQVLTVGLVATTGMMLPVVTTASPAEATACRGWCLRYCDDTCRDAARPACAPLGP